MSEYAFWERDLATKFMEDFHDSKKIGKLSAQEVDLFDKIDNNPITRNYVREIYRVDKKERAEHSGIYTLVIDGKGREGTRRSLMERDIREGFERGAAVVVGGGLTGALSMEVARRLYPDNPEKQLALGEVVVAGSELFMSAFETVAARHEFKETTRKATEHGLDFELVGKREPGPPSEEKKPLEVEIKEEGEQSERAKEHQQQPEKQIKENTETPTQQEASRPAQHKFYEPMDNVTKTNIAEPFYKPETGIPLKTDANILQPLDKARDVAGTQIPIDGKPPVVQTGEGISYRAANPFLNLGKHSGQTSEQNEREKKDKPEKKETVNKKQSVERTSDQSSAREANPFLNQNKDKAQEKSKEVKENQEAKPGG